MDSIPQNHLPTVSGIYCIRCIANNKIYVGSAIRLSQRWYKHLHGLRHNIHPNRHLQNAFNLYGESAFVFEVLEYVLTPDLLTAREQYWFRKLSPFGKRGFNYQKIAGSNIGMKSPKRGKPGKKASPETRARISISLMGNTRTRGKRASLETRKKQSIAHLGRKHTEEHKRKIAEANSGKTHGPEARVKVSTANKGRRHESRRKTLIVIAPDGTEYLVHGITEWAKENHLNYQLLMRVAQGKAKQHRGWRARFP